MAARHARMTLIDVQVGRHLRQHRTELAQATVARARRPRRAAQLGPAGPSPAPEPAPTCDGDDAACRALDDTVALLDFLAAAITVGRPVLFDDYVTWARDVAARPYADVATFDLAGTLAALQDVLRDLLPPAYFDATAPYLAAAAIAVSSAPAAAGPGERGGAGEPIPRAARDYLTAVLSGDRAAARDLVTAVYAAGASLDRVYLDILQPAQRESGRLWQAGRISVAQEHYLTAETQAVMALLSAGRAPPGPRHRASSSTASAADLNVDRDRRGSTSHTWRDSITDNRTGAAPRKVFLAACVAGEFHDVGLRMVGDLLERAGWDVYFCGANTPSDALAAEAALRRATVVGLSATIATHLDPLAQTVRDLRRAPQTAATPILVGGRPFLLAPDLAPRVGATAWAPDAARAVTLAESLVAGN